MSKRFTTASVVCGVALLFSSSCASSGTSALISAFPLNFTPTSTMPVLEQYTLNAINDGRGMVAAESINGFASTQGTGTISFTFRGCATVESFDIWNNINRTTNGVTHYTLRLYGTNGHLLRTIVVGPVPKIGPGGADVGKFSTALGGTAFVHRIDMEITASAGRAEIREIQITGSESGDAGACGP